MDATITVVGDLVEESLGHIKVSHGASRASVNNGGIVGRAVLALDGDGLAAEWVLVGVAVRSILVKNHMADGDDGLVRRAGDTTCAQADVVVSEVTSVGLSNSAGAGRWSR